MFLSKITLFFFAIYCVTLVLTSRRNLLHFLILYSNRVTRDGAGHLAKLLLKKNTPLEILNLAYNRIEDDGACALSEALAHSNRHLRT